MRVILGEIIFNDNILQTAEKGKQLWGMHTHKTNASCSVFYFVHSTGVCILGTCEKAYKACEYMEYLLDLVYLWLQLVGKSPLPQSFHQL